MRRLTKHLKTFLVLSIVFLLANVSMGVAQINLTASNGPIAAGGMQNGNLLETVLLNVSSLNYTSGLLISSNALSEDIIQDGTAENPFIITTAEQLGNIRNDLAAHYQLGADIDLENAAFTPIGTSSVPFSGSFDGAGYTIKNLKINVSTDNAGFFGYSTGTLRNITIEGADITGGVATGGLVGYQKNGMITKCAVIGEGSVKGASTVGGLVGYKDTLAISDSFSEADVTGLNGTGNIGGLVGHNVNAGDIKNCYATGNVTSPRQSGGLVGSDNKVTYTIENCFALGDISDDSKTGGITVGAAAIIKNSYYSGKITCRNRTGISLGSNITSSYFNGFAATLGNEKFSKLPASMKRQQTFIGWDFENTWSIDEGASYPYLKNLKKPVKVSEGLPEKDMESGTGTAEDPYIIKTAAQINNVQYEPTAHYQLGADIDLENAAFTPIGTSTAPFSGSFDGADYTIKNLKINVSGNNVGFFGYSAGILKNITIEGANVTGGNSTGGLVGYQKNGMITNCAVIGNGLVQGNTDIGGLVGCKDNLTISHSFSEVAVTADNGYGGAGGLVGKNMNGGAIKNCYAAGNITCSGNSGGLVGVDNKAAYTIENCFALGNINDNSAAAGITVGTAAIIKNSYYSGQMTCRSITGISKGNNITSSYFNSTITGITTPDGQARSTEQMLSQATYIGWDFDNVWKIDEDITYPYLRNMKRPASFPTAALPIDTPADFKVTGQTSTSVSLEWGAVENAISYEIEIAGEIKTVSQATKITINDLNPDTSYSIKIRAKRGNSVSDWSAAIDVRTNINIGFPQNILVKAQTSTSITLVWDAVDGADAYQIEYNGKVVITAELSIVLNNLTPDTEYSIRIRVKVGDKYGDWSAAVKVITNLSIEAPKNIRVDSQTSTSITLSWDAVDGADGYEIEYNGKVIVTTDVTVVLTNLTPDTEYSIRIRVKAGNKFGDWSIYIKTTTNISISVPGNIVIHGQTSTSIDLSWDAVDGADGYEIEYNGKIIFTNDIKVVLEHLTADTDYNIRIRVKVGNKHGDWSAFIKVTTNISISIPGNIKIGDSTSSTISLSWDEVDGADGYEIEYNGKIVITDEIHIILSGLTADTEYNIRIRAKVGGKHGDWSDFVKITTNISVSAPGNIVINNQTSTSIDLSWDAVDGADGYEIEYNGKIIFTNDINIVIDHLTADTDYNIRIRVKVGDKHGDWSAGIKVTTNISISSPKNIVIDVKAATSISLSWDAVEGADAYEVEYNGKVLITEDINIVLKDLTPDTEYKIRIRVRSKGKFGDWSSVIVIKTNSLTNVTILWEAAEDADEYIVKYNGQVKITDEAKAELTDLIPGKVYPVIILGKNDGSLIDWSLEINVKANDNTVYTAPQNIVVTAKTSTSISLSWDEVEGAKEYEIRYNNQTIRTKDTHVVINKLTPETDYQIWVRAYIYEAMGSWSDVKSVRTGDRTINGAPEGIKVDSKTSSSITLSWDPLTGVDEYEVEYNGKTIVTSDTNIELTGLNPDTGYSIKVRGKKGDENGEWSASIEVTTNITISIPSNVKVDSSTSVSADLSWDAVPGAEEYEVEYNGKVITTSDVKVKIEELESDTEYSIRIRGKNGKEYGEWSVSVKVVTNITISISKEIRVDAKNSNSIALSWDAIAGAGIYEIEYNGTIITTNERNIALKNLTPDTEYRIRLRGKTDTEEGEWNSAILVKTNALTNVTVLWDGIDEIEEYVLDYDGQKKVTTEAKAVLTNLVPDQEYKVIIHGKIGGVFVDWNLEFMVKAEDNSIYKAPGNIEVKSKTADSISFSWEEVSGAEEYEIEYNNQYIRTHDTNIILEDLTPDTEYGIKIRACIGDAFSKWSPVNRVRTSESTIANIPGNVTEDSENEDISIFSDILPLFAA